MVRKISFINYKGGVGKTSLIVNTAAALASRRKRVLLVDLDTQSNASIWLLRLQRWNTINSTGRGGIYSIYDPGQETVKDIIVKDVVVDKNGEKILPGLDLIPTTFNFVDLENEYEGEPGKPHYVKFYEQLKEVQDDYDFILFDCPPNILKGAQVGIFASNEIYVPSNPDALSLIGFTLLVEKLLIFNRRSASFRLKDMGTPAQVQGIIFNAIQDKTDIEVPKMRMQLRLNQFRNQKRVGGQAKIFKAQVRDASVVRRAVTLGLPVSLVGSGGADEEDNVQKDYLSIADEIIQHQETPPHRSTMNERNL
ncbi:MAG: ParA family protein [Opitutales bacterium]